VVGLLPTASMNASWPAPPACTVLH
jgi:hypothetical protein